MPKINEMRYARELGKPKSNTNWYKWVACVDCGKEHWVTANKDGSIKTTHHHKYTGRCLSCSIKFNCSFGENHARWKGGANNIDGYIHVRLYPDDFFYPMAKKDGYVAQHRLVVAQSLKRNLHSWEIVHHKNHIRNDNRIENLQLVSDDRHNQITIMESKINRILLHQDSLLKEVRLLRLENRMLREQPENKRVLNAVR